LDASLEGAAKKRLWVTGHSLGGALAKLWALWAVARGHEVAGVYTFGQPRVGDASFATLYNSVLRDRSFRVVHADDIVPRVPWMLSRYRHAGHEVLAQSRKEEGRRKKNSSFIIDPSVARKLAESLSHAVRALHRGRLALLDDHHISRYLELFSEN
jgi:hypothetical protein